MCLKLPFPKYPNSKIWIIKNILSRRFFKKLKMLCVPKQAKQDIFCYKFYRVDYADETLLFPPFKEHDTIQRYRLGDKLPRVSFSYSYGESHKEGKETIYHKSNVEAGYHSLASADDLPTIMYYYGKIPPHFEIFLCKIPKGAYYHIGEFHGSKAFASNELEILQKVHFTEIVQRNTRVKFHHIRY